jgi:tetratricopeptide (TPR) repeat protein
MSPFSLDQVLSAGFFFLNSRVARLINIFSKTKDQFHFKLKNPIKGSSLRLALTVAIILIVLIGLYIVVTPPKSTGTNTAPTTIEIIGGNTITPDKPQGLEIAAADFGSFNTSAADSEFARNDDLARVNAYRDAERLSRMSEPHLARAKAFLANGALIFPPDANAYSEYAAVIRMDPTNKEARLGLDSVLSQIISEVDDLIDQFDFASASEMLAIAQKLAPDNQELKLKNESIRIAEEVQNQQVIAEQARIDAEVKKATTERQRKQQIEKLLSKALTAFNENRLISPPGENALTLYRATLDLDPSNQRARNGLGNISSIYIRQARDSLSINDLEGTADHLEIALSINPENEAALSLDQQLKRRKYLVTEQQRLQAEASENINLAQQMSDEQDQLNLYSGIQAYYDGDYAQALQFLKPLADKNDPRAQVRVARMLLEARATSRDKPEAIRMFSAALAPVQLAASQGHAWAQSDLADYYFDGLVIDQDRRTAAVWYQRAAEQGYAPAQTNLGWLYFNGYDGVAPNRAVAIHWFNEAAAQGNQAAAKNLRALGESVPQSAGG